MPKLFIANTTKQIHDFICWLPGVSKLYQTQIKPGSQVMIGDFTTSDIDNIVKQHAVYGLRASRDVPKDREYVGLCYSVDKPVTMTVLYDGFAKNDEILNERAEVRREEQAAAIAANIKQTMAEHGVDVPRAEVTLVEETRGGVTPSIAKGYEVVDEGVLPRHGNTPGIRARQAQAKK